jgi:hypothetical protein
MKNFQLGFVAKSQRFSAIIGLPNQGLNPDLGRIPPLREDLGFLDI